MAFASRSKCNSYVTFDMSLDISVLIDYFAKATSGLLGMYWDNRLWPPPECTPHSLEEHDAKHNIRAKRQAEQIFAFRDNSYELVRAWIRLHVDILLH